MLRSRRYGKMKVVGNSLSTSSVVTISVPRMAWLTRTADGVPLVPLVGKGDPVEGVGKDTLHASVRFGVP